MILPRLIPFLSATTALLGMLYLALVAGAVFYAGAENSLRAEARATEMRVATLESEYYDLMEALGDVEPSSFGLVTPARVVYISEDGSPALSRAE